MRAHTLALMAVFLLSFGLGAALPACTNQIHIATVADTGLVDALHTARITESQAFSQALFPVAQHRKNLALLIRLDTDALALTDAIIAWKQAGAVAPDLPALVATARTAIHQIQIDLKDQPLTSPFMRALAALLVFLN